MLIVYRGLSVDADRSDEVRRTIESHGLTGDEGFWRFVRPAPRLFPTELIDEPDLNHDDTEANDWAPVVCCCGDYDGACFYATKTRFRKGRPQRGLVIEIAARDTDLCVDGRDFLYTAFQLWDRYGTGAFSKQITWLERIFGSSVRPYFERAASSADQDFRIAQCDLACQDPLVVTDHYANRIRIGGRYGTVFCSAFFLTAPVPASSIVAMHEVDPNWHPKEPDIRIADFVAGRLP